MAPELPQVLAAVFTGLIEDLGRIEEVSPLATGRRLRIATELPTAEMAIGASIAVSGACMTVTERTEHSFVVEISAESLRKTTLGDLQPGDRVNLERSLRLNDRIGGHLVTGHVDGIGRLVSLVEEGESAIFTFELPTDLGRSTVEKGSIAVDGISLTCFKCVNGWFDVAIIAHTRKVTTLGSKRVGDRVNIETDLLGKYVARWLEPHGASAARTPPAK